MTTRHPVDMFPGRRQEPLRRYEMPPPEIPKTHMSWFSKLMVIFAALLIVGLLIGFWRAAATPPAEDPATLAPTENAPATQATPATGSP